MGFKADNKYFIQHELRGIDYTQYDGLLKNKTRERLRNSYIESSDKLLFYQEAFEVLADLELGCLALNLFFEEDYIKIFIELTREDEQLKNKLISKYSIFKSLELFLEENSLDNEEFIFFYLQERYGEISSGFRIEHLSDFSTENQNPIVREVTKQINKSIKEGKLEAATHLFVLFTKIFNSFKSFSDIKNAYFNNSKAILFYNLMEKNLDSNINDTSTMIYLRKFINLLSKESESLFNTSLYLPLLENSCDSFTEGYNKVEKALMEKIKSLEIYSLTDDQPYSLMIRMIDLIAIESQLDFIKAFINRKIERFEAPLEEELSQLATNNTYYSGEVLSYLKERLYKFEDV